MDPASDLVAQVWRTLVDDDSPTAQLGMAELRITGAGGQLASQFRVEDAAIACVSVALAAAAALCTDSPPKRVALDRDHVAAAVRSERYFRSGQSGTAASFAPLSRFWPTADGWIRSHANYPWHKAAFLGAIGASDEDPVHIESLTRDATAEELEEKVFATGGIAAAVRTLDEWRRHPQGVALSTEPLIGHERAGHAPARNGPTGGASSDDDHPAGGLRVLDMTRVIAGPVCTRLLGALGANVLRVDPPGHPDMPLASTADSLLGKRSAGIDLGYPEGIEALHELMAAADVFVCGYRPGALDRFGLAPADVVERHPGLVVVVLDAWGHTGPWAGRRGFDSVVQAPTGIAAGEAQGSGSGQPGALPCQLLDHGTGYLAAAAALDGVRRQRASGGSHIRRLSLARTAAWLTGAGAGEGTAGKAGAARNGATKDATGPERWTVDLGSGPSTVRAVAPPGAINGAPLRWSGPPACYQQDAPAWNLWNARSQP